MRGVDTGCKGPWNLGTSPRSGRHLSPDARVPSQLWGAGQGHRRNAPEVSQPWFWYFVEGVRSGTSSTKSTAHGTNFARKTILELPGRFVLFAF